MANRQIRHRSKSWEKKFAKCYNPAMKKLLVSISMIALLGAGCSGSAPSASAPEAQAPAPAQKMSTAQFLTGSWKIKSMQRVGGGAEDVASLGLALSFDGERMTGKVCNNMSGSYTVEDNLVKFGPVASTKMFCQGLPGEVETALSSGFASNYTIIKQGEDLVMQGAAVFVLERSKE